jgi:RNase P/RNase MRP subunit p29
VKVALVILAAMLSACGYRVNGNALPPSLKTVAIPAFTNATIQYKLTDVLPQAFAREFNSHTRYRVVSDPSKADMVLTGEVITYTNNPTIFDQVLQRANVADLHVTMRVSLTERATGRILFQQPEFEIKESFQISPNAGEFFEESEPAIRRASERVAQKLVTAILENF